MYKLDFGINRRAILLMKKHDVSGNKK